MNDLTIQDLFAIIQAEYANRDPAGFAADIFPPGTRWVMDLRWYKQVRAACQQAGAIYPNADDPDKWVPDPKDVLYGLPIDVREDGGEPHLERMDRAGA